MCVDRCITFELVGCGKEGKFPIYFKCQLVVKEANTHRLSSIKFMIRPSPIQSFYNVKPRYIDRSWGIHIYQKV